MCLIRVDRCIVGGFSSDVYPNVLASALDRATSCDYVTQVMTYQNDESLQFLEIVKILKTFLSLTFFMLEIHRCSASAESRYVLEANTLKVKLNATNP